MENYEFRQKILLNYPNPLALTYKRMDDQSLEDSPSQKHLLLGDLFEVVLKYCSSIAIGQYFKDKKLDAKINRQLQNLKRPSLGHWISFLRDILNYYHKSKYELLLPELYDFYNKKNKSLKASQECYKYIGELLETKKYGGILCGRDIFDLLTTYRNKTRGHGATSRSREYRERVRYIQPALEENLRELEFITGFKLVYVKEIKYTKKLCKHRIILLTGIDERGTDYLCDEANRLENEHLYLFRTRGKILKPLFSLNPLMIYHLCDDCRREQVFFLNEGKGNRLEYLSYSCGHSFIPDSYLKDFEQLIERISSTLLTEDEQIYYEKLKEVWDDGILEDYEKIDLEDLLDILDIKKDRIIEIEEMVKTEFDLVDEGEVDEEKLNKYRKLLENLSRRGIIDRKWRELLKKKASSLNIPPQIARELEAELYYKKGLLFKGKGEIGESLIYLEEAMKLMPDVAIYRTEIEFLKEEKKKQEQVRIEQEEVRKAEEKKQIEVKLEEEKRRKAEEEKKREEDRLKKEKARKLEQERRKAEEEKKREKARKLEQERRKAEEEKKREKARKLEQERRKAEEETKKITELSAKKSETGSVSKAKKEKAWITPDMMLIPGGSFRMGSQSPSSLFDIFSEDKDEKPLHFVKLKSYYLGKYTVTNKEYCLFLNSKGMQKEEGSQWILLNQDSCGITCEPESGIFRVKKVYEDHPVVFVSWYGAVAYCNWLSEQEGFIPCYGSKGQRGNSPSVWINRNGYRLPTEAEWEYACRGRTATRYYWGNNINSSYCWYWDNSGGNLNEVGQKKPNQFGLYDMSGNICEWCNDWYGPYGDFSQTDPVGPVSGQQRVLRGGSWNFNANNCQSSNRYKIYPDSSSNTMGFRLARSS